MGFWIISISKMGLQAYTRSIPCTFMCFFKLTSNYQSYLLHPATRTTKSPLIVCNLLFFTNHHGMFSRVLTTEAVVLHSGKNP